MKIFTAIEQLMARRWIEYLARCSLAAVFVYSGVDKLLHFQAACAEFAAVGLQPSSLFVGAVILTQLGGSVLLFVRRYAMWGALPLAAFTALATLIAHRFWEASPSTYTAELNVFLEHLGLIGAFLLVAHIEALRNQRGAV